MDVYEFVMRTASQPPHNTSKKRNKVGSGRAGRRTYNSSKSLVKVGGFSNFVRAIYFDADPNMEGMKDGAPQPLCHVVPSSKGMRDGQPFRSPQVQPRSLGGKG